MEGVLFKTINWDFLFYLFKTKLFFFGFFIQNYKQLVFFGFFIQNYQQLGFFGFFIQNNYKQLGFFVLFYSKQL